MNVLRAYKGFILVGFTVLLWALTFAPHIRGDDTTYLVLARSFAERGDFAALHIVGTPAWSHQPMVSLIMSSVTRWWPDYPAMLTPAVVVAALIPGLIVLLLTWRWLALSSVLSSDLRWWVWLLTATNFVLIPYMTQHAMTEAWYMAFSLLALLAIEGYVRKTTPTLHLTLLFAGLAAAAAYLTPAVGITLIMAFPLHLLLRGRQWSKAVAVTATAVAGFLPYAIRNARLGESALGGRYSDVLLRRDYWGLPDDVIASPLELIPRVFNNIWTHAVDSMPKVMVPLLRHPNVDAELANLHLTPLVTVIGLAITGLIVAGYLISLRRDFSAVHLYFPLYTGLVLLPAWVTERNWLPVLPFLIAWMVIGLVALLHWLADLTGRPSFRRPAWVAVILTGFLLMTLVRDVGHLRDGARYRALGVPWVPAERALADAAHWLVQNSDPNDLVLYVQPQHQYLYTGRQTTPLLSRNDVVQISSLPQPQVEADIRANFDYVLYSPTYDLIPGFSAAVGANVDWLEPVYDTGTVPDITIYRVIREAGERAQVGP